jgi:hypothetical protein
MYPVVAEGSDREEQYACGHGVRYTLINSDNVLDGYCDPRIPFVVADKTIGLRYGARHLDSRAVRQDEPDSGWIPVSHSLREWWFERMPRPTSNRTSHDRGSQERRSRSPQQLHVPPQSIQIEVA